MPESDQEGCQEVDSNIEVAAVIASKTSTNNSFPNHLDFFTSTRFTYKIMYVEEKSC